MRAIASCLHRLKCENEESFMSVVLENELCLHLVNLQVVHKLNWYTQNDIDQIHIHRLSFLVHSIFACCSLHFAVETFSLIS